MSPEQRLRELEDRVTKLERSESANLGCVGWLCLTVILSLGVDAVLLDYRIMRFVLRPWTE